MDCYCSLWIFGFVLLSKSTHQFDLDGSFSVITRAHVRKGSADCDGADMEALQHFAEAQPFIKGAWTVDSSLKGAQRKYKLFINYVMVSKNICYFYSNL